MSDARVIAYPQSFLERPEDRLFLAALRGLGVAADSAKLYLYRIWADFATGGSDRRELAAPGQPGAEAGFDSNAGLIEGFVGWSGGRGELLRAALAAGFLRMEGSFLVCKDFFPINSSWSSSGKSFQRKGAYTRAVNRQREEAEVHAGKQLAIWDATKPAGIGDMTREEREKALIFIHRLGRALSFAPPPDAELRAGPLQAAGRILAVTDDRLLDDTLLWLVSQSKNPDIPRKLPELLDRWPALVEQAAREVM